MLLACAALTLVVTFLAVPHADEDRRLARLFWAQQEWAEQMDRRAEQSRLAPLLPCPARKGRFRAKQATSLR